MTTGHHSLERIDPEMLQSGEVTGDATLELHLERYRFAAANLVGGHVLDLACGVGYGTSLLAAVPTVDRVTGVDVASEAIAHARRAYAASKITYVLADGAQFGDAGAYDTVVSLETIEHVDDAARFVAHLATLVRPGGRLIGSVPVTPSMDGNPHHRTDFTPRSFRELGRSIGFREVDALTQYQPFGAVGVVTGRETRVGRSRSGLLRWYARHPDSLVRRVLSTIQHGFVNIYRTQVWERPM